MFPTFHLKWGPQYGSPSPSCQAHLLCSSESDVRTLVPGEEWRKLCQNVVQHGLVSTHFNQLGMWKSVHIRFFFGCVDSYPPPLSPAGIPEEQHWTPLTSFVPLPESSESTWNEQVVQGPVSLQCCTMVWRNTSWCLDWRWQSHCNVGKTMP